MGQKKILNPLGWPRPSGYSNGIWTEGKQIFVAGQVGWNKDETLVGPGFVEQFRQVLINTLEILKTAEAGAEDIVRMTWFIVDKKEYLDNLSEIGTIYRQHMGRNYPVMSVVQVAGLIEDGAKLEIETTAVI